MGLNGFRLVADFMHLLSKCILIFTIHSTRSAEGISLLTQSLYAIVFCTRYLDLFYAPLGVSWYNTLFKIFYISSSFYILFLMLRVYPRTREDERQWRIAGWIMVFSLIVTPVCMLIFKNHMSNSYWAYPLWVFSIALESVCVLPQLTLLAHTSIPTAITSYYLLALGSYRMLYIPNWIYRAKDPHDGYVEPIAIIFGVIQTLLYLEFGWIYFQRQKVKLRHGGGVLDGEEFARGLVLGRLIGKEIRKTGERTTSRGWRGGGVSVSADEGLAPEEFEVRDEELSDEEEDALEREADVEHGLIGGRRA